MVCCPRAGGGDDRIPTNPGRHPMRGVGRLTLTLGMIATSVALAACGGGARQDVHEVSGKFPVSISVARFPGKQRLAEHTRLTIAVTNTGKHPIPDVSVTLCNVTCAFPAPPGQGTSV